MQNFINDQNINLLSPTMFISGLERPQCADNLKLEPDSPPLESQADFFCKISGDDGTKGSFRDEKKRLAGLKSREKKKKYVQTLEQHVKALSAEIQQYENEISKCKDKLVQAIRTANHSTNEHAYTFTQLERHATSEDPDIDRINLLLDLIQNRIGANGKERQANLEYNFKQIINSMFPAMHRYFMHSAVRTADLFDDCAIDQIEQRAQPWTQQFIREVKLTPQQIAKIRQMQQAFVQKRKDAISYILRLKNVKNDLKQQQGIFQRWMSDIREDMSPIQSALIAIFGQKNKLRREFELGVQFSQSLPSKRVKLQE